MTHLIHKIRLWNTKLPKRNADLVFGNYLSSNLAAAMGLLVYIWNIGLILSQQRHQHYALDPLFMNGY